RRDAHPDVPRVRAGARDRVRGRPRRRTLLARRLAARAERAAPARRDVRRERHADGERVAAHSEAVSDQQVMSIVCVWPSPAELGPEESVTLVPPWSVVNCGALTVTGCVWPSAAGPVV